MKLDLALLKKFVALPSTDPIELRHVLDDLGLEVEATEVALGRTIFNIETLAQRGDHLSALGVSREFAGRYLTKINFPQLLESLPSSSGKLSVKVDTEFCSAYSILDLELASSQVAPEAQEFLEQDNAQPMIVQLSNYVLSELGQPTHAFDYQKISGSLRVVLSSKEEEIIALDQKTYRVPAQSLLIKDDQKTVAVAGVIGCANSMVTPETTRVLIESANFCPTHVRKTARGMGLSTDASYAFERGVDLQLSDIALRRVALLAVGSRPVDYASVKNTPALTKLTLAMSRVRGHLNDPRLAVEVVAQKLLALGYLVQAHQETLDVTVPSWRYWNVKTEAALLEDYCRTVSYNSLKPIIPAATLEDVPEHPSEFLISKFEPVLIGQGFTEVVTRSYYSADDVALISELSPQLGVEHLKIINSLEGAYSNLKITNLLHLARVVMKSQKFNIPAIKVYEFGRLFNKNGYKDSSYQFEDDFLTLACAGRWHDNFWKKPEALSEQIANLSGVLQSLLTTLKIDFRILKSEHPLLHPGRQAKLVAGNKELAIFGVIHPLIKDRLGLKEDLVFGEVCMRDCYQSQRQVVNYEIIDLPPIKWELTFKLPKRHFASEILAIIEDLRPKFLKSISLLDSFEKPQEDFTRVSYRLLFQEASRTLSNDEVDQIVAEILQVLKTKHQLEIVT